MSWRAVQKTRKARKVRDEGPRAADAGDGIGDPSPKSWRSNRPCWCPRVMVAVDVALCSTSLSLRSGFRLLAPSSAGEFGYGFVHRFRALSFRDCLATRLLAKYRNWDQLVLYRNRQQCGGAVRERQIADFAKIRARAAKRKGGDAVSALRCLARCRTIARRRRSGRPHPFDDGGACFRGRLRVARDRAEMAGLRGGFPRLRAEAAAVPAGRFLARPRLRHAHRAQPAKDQSVRDNAAFVERVSKEHGGFGKFLAGVAGRRPGRADGLSRQARQPAWRQHRSVFAALAWLGLLHHSNDMVLRCAMPAWNRRQARHRRRIWRTSRIRSTRWAPKTGLPRSHISRILAMSIGENHSAGGLREYMGE